MADLTGGILQAWHFAVEYMRDRRRTNAMRREFWELGEEESSAVLSGLGLTSRDFHEAMRLPYASHDLSAAALESVGVDRAAFRWRYAAWDHDIRRTCMSCLARRRCLRELKTGGFASSHRQFCPNSSNIDDLINDPEAAVYVKPAA